MYRSFVRHFLHTQRRLGPPALQLWRAAADSQAPARQHTRWLLVVRSSSSMTVNAHEALCSVLDADDANVGGGEAVAPADDAAAGDLPRLLQGAHPCRSSSFGCIFPAAHRRQPSRQHAGAPAPQRRQRLPAPLRRLASRVLTLHRSL